MIKFEILDWVKDFDESKEEFSLKTDTLETDSRILYPGRFYILKYKGEETKRFNAFPVVISIGISKKDPESFLCIDLSILPKKIRLQFISMFFDIYKKEIMDNIDKFPDIKDAEKQIWMKSFNYESIIKAVPMFPLKFAVKRYKIRNTMKIYALPFSKVYRVVGDYCDRNTYVHGTIGEVQMEFLKKMGR